MKNGMIKVAAGLIKATDVLGKGAVVATWAMVGLFGMTAATVAVKNIIITGFGLEDKDEDLDEIEDTADILKEEDIEE